MPISNQQLIIQLKARGVKLTKSQIKQLDKQVKNTQKSMKGMAAGIAAATASLVLMTKAISSFIRVGKEFEQSMANLKAITGASNKEMLTLSNTARKLGASTKFTASQVGALQTEFGKLGFSVKEIQGATGATLDLAAAVGADLSTAAAIAGQTLRAFGMDVNDTNIVTDVMAKSMASSALDMSKFTDSMSYVAPVAKMAGFGIQGTTAMLGTLANAGIHGSLAGTALRKIFLELSNESSKLSKRLGGPIKNVEELIPALAKLKKEGIGTAEMKELVGLRAVSAFSILTEGTDTIGELTEKLNDANGSAKEMAEIQLDTLEGKLTILNSAWEGMGIAIMDNFLPAMKSATDGLTLFIQGATGVIETSMADKIMQEQMQFNALVTSLQGNLDKLEIRERLIKQINDIHPDFLKGMQDEELTADNLKKALVSINEQYKQRILAAAQEKIVTEAMTTSSEAFSKQTKQLVEYNKKLNAMSTFTGIAIDDSKTFAENLAIQSEGQYALMYNIGKGNVSQEEQNRILKEFNKHLGGSGAKNLKGASNRFSILYNQVKKLIPGLEEAEDASQQAFSESQIVIETATKMLEKYGLTINTVTGQVETLNNTIKDDGNGEDDEDGKDEGDEGPPIPVALPSDIQARLKENEQILTDWYGYWGDTKFELLEEQKTAELEAIDAWVQAQAKLEIDATKEAAVAKERIDAAYNKKKKQMAFESFSAGVSMMAQNLNAAAEAGIVSQKTAKAASAVSTIIKTYESAQNAYNSMVGIPVVGPALGAVAAAAAIAAGMGQLAKIKGTAEEKPETGNVEKYISAGKAAAKAQMGGLIGGKLHKDGGTMIEAEKGEFILNRRAVQSIGLENLNEMNSMEEGGLVDTGVEAPTGVATAPIQVTFSGNVLSRDFVESDVIEVLQDFTRRGGSL